ncbi:ranBP-type and C3HC4-type zinc finger-containing protein 1-like, partial [Tropilaelaps mercedesae]
MNPTRWSLLRRSSLDETNYLDRLGIFDNRLWPTLTEFNCPLCGIHVGRFQGVLLKNCQIHRFCRNCLRQAALDSPWLEVSCPLSIQCHSTVNEGELQELLSLYPHMFEVYSSKKSRRVVENDLTQLYPFIMDCELIVNLEEFECPICMETVPILEGVCAKTCGIHYVC